MTAKFKAEHRESGKRDSELKVARESKVKRITFDTNTQMHLHVSNLSHGKHMCL